MSDEITKRLAEIEARVNAATPGRSHQSGDVRRCGMKWQADIDDPGTPHEHWTGKFIGNGVIEIAYISIVMTDSEKCAWARDFADALNGNAALAKELEELRVKLAFDVPNSGRVGRELAERKAVAQHKLAIAIEALKKIKLWRDRDRPELAESVATDALAEIALL